MKKQNKVLFFISVLLITLVVINLINAQTTPTDTNTNPAIPPSANTIGSGDVDPETGLPKEVLPIKKAGDIVSDEDKRTAYLKAEWEKILLKSETFGPFIRLLQRLDPVSNFLLGLPITFSWFFFLTITLWIAFVIIIFRITSLFEIQNKWVHYIIALAIVGVITYFRQPKSIAQFVVGLITILNRTWWMQYVIIAIVILAVILAVYFSKQLSIVWNFVKEKNEKNIDHLKKAKFEENMKNIDELTKTLSK